jgi:predicted phage terminase large subunit-like protein
MGEGASEGIVVAAMGLGNFITWLSPAYARPSHLEGWMGLVERARAEGVRGLCSVPVRHWKTWTTVHGIVWLLLKDPTRRIVFLTHSFEAAEKWGKEIRKLAEALDHRLGADGKIGPTRGWNKIVEWRNASDGGVVVMSADQSRIGYDCHVLVVDDPIDENGAKEPDKREEVDTNITFYTGRCIRNGVRGPVLIVASRFHPDDPIGRRIERKEVAWEYVHNQAITFDEKGGERAFAPHVMDLGALHSIRAELAESDPYERVWFSQFQNDPRPEGTDMFGPPTFYPAIPTWTFRLAHGADLSFVDGPGSDYFAMCSAKIYGSKAFVLEVRRTRLDAVQIEGTARSMMGLYGRGPIYSYMSGPEIGTAKLMRERGLPFLIMRARYNKLVRAQRTIKRWNDGDIALPEGAPWVRAFVHRVQLFRGHEKDRDDEVDALVSMCDGAIGGAVGGGPKSLGRSYEGFNSR